MRTTPVNLTEALATFDDVYSPRIVARMNDYDVRIAHTRGEHVWHVHADTDEFFLVLDGRFDVAMRDVDGHETTVVLRVGDTFVDRRAPNTSRPRRAARSSCSSRPGPQPPETATRARSRITSTAPPATRWPESSR